MVIKRGQKAAVRKSVLPIILVIFLIIIFFRVSPNNIFIINFVSFIVGLLGYLISALFLKKRYAIIAATGIFLASVLKMLGLLDPVNFLILVCLIAAITIFINQK